MKIKTVPVVTETRAESLRRSLEQQIVRGELRPGDRLDEVELAERFNVSRTPVREALHALAAAGLIEMRSRQGATVSTVSISMLLEMFQIMAELEGLCASFAARRANAAQRRNLQAIHERLVRVIQDDEPEAFYEVNREFHEAIYDASNSEFIAEQTLALRNRVSPYRRYVTFLPGRMTATLDEHERVLNAILTADSAGAQAAMRDHVTLLGDNLTDFIAAIPPSVLKTARAPGQAFRRLFHADMPFGRDTSGPEFVGDLVAFGRQDTQFGTIARLPLAPAARRRLAGLIAAGASLVADIVEIDRAVPGRSEGQAQAVLRLPRLTRHQQHHRLRPVIDHEDRVIAAGGLFRRLRRHGGQSEKQGQGGACHG